MQSSLDNKVQVWIERTADYSDISDFESVLDESERIRAGRFIHDHDRRNFIVAHGLKRKCLAEIAGTGDPSALQFSAYSSGKPYLRDANIHFNLSHSHGISAIAISSAPCGVDIEVHRPIGQLGLLIRKTMTASERSLIEQAPSPLKVFIERWVIKEAFLKLSGIGLGLPLASLCTVSELLNLQNCFGILRGASLYFKTDQDYSIAVSSAKAVEFELKNSQMESFGKKLPSFA